MANERLYLQRLTGGSVNASSTILFDSTLLESGNISYNNVTGEVTINEPGTYVVNWTVSTQGITSLYGPIFSLNTSQGTTLRNNSPIKSGQITGNGIIEVTTTPVTLWLTNSDAGRVDYALHMPIRATLSVCSITSAPVLSSYCFSIAQLAHVLNQFIAFYPTSTMTIYTTSLATVTGVPDRLYTSPNASGPSLFILQQNESLQVIAVPLDCMIGLYAGNDTIYNPATTFLAPPSPLPSGCDTDQIVGIQDYLSENMEIALRLGVTIQASGLIIKNEYGLIVLSDVAGNTPILIPTPKITSIIQQNSTLKALQPIIMDMSVK